MTNGIRFIQCAIPRLLRIEETGPLYRKRWQLNDRVSDIWNAAERVEIDALVLVPTLTDNTQSKQMEVVKGFIYNAI